MTAAKNVREALLPCPFCVGAARQVKSQFAAWNTPSFFIVCDACDFGLPIDNTEDEAAARWNTRKLSATAAGDVKDGVSGAVMNANLCTFSQDWLIDGDYMRCRECDRPQIASCAEMVFPHAPGCRNMGLHRHPWLYFASLIRPISAIAAQESP